MPKIYKSSFEGKARMHLNRDNFSESYSTPDWLRGASEQARILARKAGLANPVIYRNIRFYNQEYCDRQLQDAARNLMHTSDKWRHIGSSKLIEIRAEITERLEKLKASLDPRLNPQINGGNGFKAYLDQARTMSIPEIKRYLERAKQDAHSIEKSFGGHYRDVANAIEEGKPRSSYDLDLAQLLRVVSLDD